MKKVSKRSRVLTWDREDCISDVEKKLSDRNIYKEANFKGKILQNLAETSNYIFKSLERKGKEGKELKYFTISHKKRPYMFYFKSWKGYQSGKMLLLSKIQKIFTKLMFEWDQLFLTVSLSLLFKFKAIV